MLCDLWNKDHASCITEATLIEIGVSFVSRCGHLSCSSRRFDCLLLVFVRRWGRLVARHHMNHDGRLWLVRFDPHCSAVKLFPERSDLKLFPRRFAGVPVSCCVSWSLVSTLQGFQFRCPYWCYQGEVLRVYQCECRSINFTSFQSRWWQVLLACSETAEVWVRASRISPSCSLILSCIDLPVSPM